MDKLDKSIKLTLAIILWSIIGFAVLSIIIGVIYMIEVPGEEETVIHTGDPSDELLQCLRKTETVWTMRKARRRTG